jgi:hypothetical protein
MAETLLRTGEVFSPMSTQRSILDRRENRSIIGSHLQGDLHLNNIKKSIATSQQLFSRLSNTTRIPQGSTPPALFMASLLMPRHLLCCCKKPLWRTTTAFSHFGRNPTPEAYISSVLCKRVHLPPSISISHIPKHNWARHCSFSASYLSH